MWSYWLQITTYFGIDSILALGMYVTMLSGQVSLGHAGFMGIGAYISAIMAAKIGLPFPLALIIGAIAGALAALIIGIVMSKRLTGLYLAVGTLAFGEAMVIIWLNIQYVGGALGFHGIPLKANPIYIFLILGILILFFIGFEKSKLSITFRAISNDEEAASTSGINIIKNKILSLVIGGFICGLGGCLFAQYIGMIQPEDFSFERAVSILMAPIIGGRQIFIGALLGSAIMVFMPELLRLQEKERFIIYGIFIVLIIILRPQGLLLRRTFMRLE